MSEIPLWKATPPGSRPDEPLELIDGDVVAS
jgi:hypothetical protein